MKITKSLTKPRSITEAWREKPPLPSTSANVWNTVGAPGNSEAEQIYASAGMPTIASWLKVVVRNSAIVEIVCFTQSVNAISHYLRGRVMY